MFKLSNYNYRIPYHNGIIYYNGLTDKSFLLSKTEDEKVQSIMGNLNLFKEKFPAIFYKFKEWGFIHEALVSEIDIIRYKYKIAITDNSYYNLVINPTLECNFRCWYCYQEHPTGHMSYKTMEKVKKHLNYIVNNIKASSLNLSWFGGEPLLYFDDVIYPISQYAKEICSNNSVQYHSHITTNASQINDDMIEKMNNIDLNSFQITLDGGKNRHNQIRNENGSPSFDLIVNNLMKILKYIQKSDVILRLNYDQQTLKDSSLIDLFNGIPQELRSKVRVDFQRVWQTYNSINNKEAERTENDDRVKLTELTKKLGYNMHIINNVFCYNTGYKCYADRKNHAEINYDGKVYSCTARGYSDRECFGEIADTGEIKYFQHKMANKLAHAPFENDTCLACKYLPICLGPCSRNIADMREQHLDIICPLHLNEISPERDIINRYENKRKIVLMHNK